MKRMAYELTGKVKLLQETQTLGSGFQKREIVVTVEEGKYPQDICLEFVQDKINLLDSLSVGQEITVTFDIRGREYNGRYYNNLQGWKISSDTTQVASDQSPVSDAGVPVDLKAPKKSREMVLIEAISKKKKNSSNLKKKKKKKKLPEPKNHYPKNGETAFDRAIKYNVNDRDAWKRMSGRNRYDR
tara:strand:- start:501 stop:1058 length:558 start_codon:yes stop_codon:yes gene_type:complete